MENRLTRMSNYTMTTLIGSSSVHSLLSLDRSPPPPPPVEPTNVVIPTNVVTSGVMSQNIWGAQSLRGSEATKPEGA